VTPDAVDVSQFCNQFVERDPVRGGDAVFNPTDHACQFAMPAAIALRPRRRRSGLAPQMDQFIHEPRRNPEVPRCLAVPMTLTSKRNDALAQLYRMWLAQPRPPHLS
jgi:hypothetical protein